MARVFRAFFLYCGLALLFAALSVLWGLPNFPSSLLGWVAVLLLPVPVTVAVEWFRERLDNADMPLMDFWGRMIDRSQYRLMITVALVAVAGVFGLGAVWMLSGTA